MKAFLKHLICHMWNMHSQSPRITNINITTNTYECGLYNSEMESYNDNKKKLLSRLLSSAHSNQCNDKFVETNELINKIPKCCKD